MKERKKEKKYLEFNRFHNEIKKHSQKSAKLSLRKWNKYQEILLGLGADSNVKIKKFW